MYGYIIDIFVDFYILGSKYNILIVFLMLFLFFFSGMKMKDEFDTVWKIIRGPDSQKRILIFFPVMTTSPVTDNTEDNFIETKLRHWLKNPYEVEVYGGRTPLKLILITALLQKASCERRTLFKISRYFCGKISYNI